MSAGVHRPSPLRLWTVLNEAVLHRVVGGTEVMGAQLQRLIDAANMPNVTLQMIPPNVGAHPAMDSMFDILQFADLAPSVAYVEGMISGPSVN